MLFLASAILLLVKTRELTSSAEKGSHSLVFGLSAMPLVLLVVIVWMLGKLLMGRRVEVIEVLDFND